MNHSSPLKILAIFLLVAVSVTVLVTRKASTQTPEPQTNSNDYRISGPYTHKNLTIFLVHGKELMPGKNFLTLQEALAQKKVIVYETKDVNELAIRNLSNQDVYVQAGDVVRGGEQDRMISVDFIVPPKSRRMPISAFCVESGRWNKRGNEVAGSFSSSNNSVASKELKLAAKRARSQSVVWEKVKVAQEKLSANTSAPVMAVESPSSYELSVENSAVKETSADYINALSGILRNKPDVIGYVFAINGHVNSADVYASRSLFVKLWPKLLKASAVEAIAELNQTPAAQPVASETIHTFLAESEKAAGAAAKPVTSRVKLVTKEDDKNIFFETQDRAEKDAWVHRNYIRKQ
jgi:hypothetical protein